MLFQSAFSYSTQQQQTMSLSGCEVRWKVDSIKQPVMTSSVAGLRRCSKALPKLKLAPKRGPCSVICCWLDPLQLFFFFSLLTSLLHFCKATAFWIPVKSLRLRSMLSKLMRCPENYVCSWHWSTEWVQSSTTPDRKFSNQCFESWMNWAAKFCLNCHFHLTSHQLTSSLSILTTFCRENTSTTSRTQKMLSKILLNPEAWIFMLQEKTYFWLAKMCWF